MGSVVLSRNSQTQVKAVQKRQQERPIMASTGLARRCRGIFQTQASLVQNSKRNSKVVLFQISEIVSRWQSTMTPLHLDSSKLVVEHAGLADMKPKPPVDQLAFGKVFTDHMLTIDWTKDGGWEAPQIQPFENFPESVEVNEGVPEKESDLSSL